MSSREILFSSPSEDKDGPPAKSQSQHGNPLSLHRKAMQHTMSGSLKHLEESLTSPAKNQASGSSVSKDMPLNATLPGDVPDAPMSVPDPTGVALSDSSMTIPEPPESEPISEGRKLCASQSHNTICERRSPRLNGERQHRPVKKFRPPDNVDEMGGIKGRRALLHGDHQGGDKSQGSSPMNGSHLASHSSSSEKKRSPETAEEKEVGSTKKEEENKCDDNR